MRFTDIFIRRPVMATVLSLLILLVGLAAVFSLPVRQYPELSNTTITVTTAYPGASAELVKGFITVPIEQAVASTEGLDTLVSSSRQNVSTVTLNLKLNADADSAATDVLSKVNQVRNVLPAEAKDPVVVKQTGEGFALMYLSFNSKEMTASQITDYLIRVVQPKLQTVAGVASAQVFGGSTFAMRVWLDPVRMAALRVTADQVRDALAANNFTAAVGQVKGDFVQVSVNAHTSLDNVDAFRRLIVASRGDAMIRLGDVATVDLGPESVDSSSVFDGLKAVFIGIYATPTANPLTVISSVRKTMPEIERQLPPSLKTDIAYDSTNFIRASIREVVITLAEAAAIVIMVIYLFLGSLRSTLIPIVTIPLSLVGVMALLLALGYSINLLTLLAMVLAIGLVVDDAIVVVENIHRHIEEGMSRIEAALQGAREIALPVIAMTITLAAVYAPIGFVSGLTGTLFREFAFTLAGAVVVSGVIALTLSPMMCSRLLSEANPEGLGAFIDRNFYRMRAHYRHRLSRTLNFRAMTILILGAVVVMTGLLYVSTPQELAPEEDQGILFALVKTPQYANLDYLEQSTDRLSKIYSSLPEAEHVFTINGTPDVHQAISGVLFKPWNERSRTAKQINLDLQGKIGDVPTVLAFAFSLPPLPGSRGGPPFQFVITTTADFAQLSTLADELKKAAMQSGMFLFLDTDLRFDLPQLEVKIDQDKASRLGWSMRDIGSSLATLLGGNNVNRFSLQGRSYEVIPQVPRDYRLSGDWLERYRIRSASGELVPLSTVVKVEKTVQPNALTGFQQLNAATISGVPFPGRTTGEAYDFMLKKAAEILPAGFGTDTEGPTRQYVQEGNTLLYAGAFAAIVIFLVLAAQYESFRDPIIILIAVPTSMFGALLPLNLAAFLQIPLSINIYTQIGLVTLIGLISKHGILMVDFANRRQAEGLSRREAIEEAAAVRLRPILMTTAAMVLATIPLLIAVGAGASSRFSLGLVIAAGMTVGTLFTLFVTPAVYTLVARDRSAAPATAALGAPSPQAGE